MKALCAMASARNVRRSAKAVRSIIRKAQTAWDREKLEQFAEMVLASSGDAPITLMGESVNGDICKADVWHRNGRTAFHTSEEVH